MAHDLSPRLHPHNDKTSRDTRLAITIALSFNVRHSAIRRRLQVTKQQIQWSKTHRPTPQKAHFGHMKVHTPEP